MKKYNTRIAPSPTGDMHVGTCRTAYFNWLAAKASGGSFLLRIDDTDEERNKPEYVEIIKETMNWLGLNYDEMIFQSQRKNRHVSMANALVDLKYAIQMNDGAIKLKIPSNMPKVWCDEVCGEIKITDKDLELINGLILVRSNGLPTYNFSSVIDDHDYEINYIIRGSDHISNTAKQIAIYSAYSMVIPKFAHIGLVHYKGKKLSKRDEAAGMLYYRNKGYNPNAVLNFLLRMGWGPTVDDKTTKTINREKAVELFLNGGKMRSASSNMDLNILESLDRKYKAQLGVWRTKERLET